MKQSFNAIKLYGKKGLYILLHNILYSERHGYFFDWI